MSNTKAHTDRWYVPLIDHERTLHIPRFPTIVVLLAIGGLVAFLFDGFLGKNTHLGDLAVPHGGAIWLWFCAVIIVLVTVTLRSPIPRSVYLPFLTFIILAMLLVIAYYVAKPNTVGVLHQIGVAIVTFFEQLPLYLVINTLILGYFLVDNLQRWFKGDVTINIPQDMTPEELPPLPALICGDLFLSSALALVLAALANGFADHAPLNPFGVTAANARGVELSHCLIPFPGDVCQNFVGNINGLHSIAYMDFVLGILCFILSFGILLTLILAGGTRVGGQINLGDVVADVTLVALGAGISRRALLFLAFRRFGYVLYPLLLMGSIGLVALSANNLGNYYQVVKSAPGCHTVLTVIDLIPSIQLPWKYGCTDVVGATASQGWQDAGIALGTGLAAAFCVLSALFLFTHDPRVDPRMIDEIPRLVLRMLFLAELAFVVPALILFAINAVAALIGLTSFWPFLEPDFFTVLSGALLGYYLWRRRSRALVNLRPHATPIATKE